MRRFRDLLRTLTVGAALLGGRPATSGALPSDWRREQPFTVSANGLVVVNLPVETLDSARPGLEDLRLYDDAGQEVPYLIERPLPAPKIVRRAKSFRVSLLPNTTEIIIETGFAQLLDGVALETPADDFIKSVQVDISSDGKSWQTISRGFPIFRQPRGAEQMRVAIPAGVWPWLRLTVDDRRSPPVPFTAAVVSAAAGEPTPTEWIPARVTERDENPSETRLALDLGAAHLTLASVEIESGEPLFTRQVALAAPQVSDEAVREETIGRGSIYRVAIPGQTASSGLSVPLEYLSRSRELVLLIENGDSPPLPVAAVRVERRPVYLAFLPRAPGMFHLLTGNQRCAAPRYDLAALNLNLKSAPLFAVKIPPPAANPNYQEMEVSPGIGLAGAPLDVSAWKYRKPVKISGAGMQEAELDLDILSRAQPGFADLRLLRGSNQIPYILRRTSIRRAITPAVTATNDARNPKLSLWLIQLPRAGLPLARLTCAARSPLFQRQVSLHETLSDRRGDTYRHELGQTSWERSSERSAKEFSLDLSERPESDALILETDNGDNPPLQLDSFKVYYPATRVIFQAGAGAEVFLYYGNPLAPPPRYDLSLVAGQVLAADKKTPTFSAEELLKKTPWGGTATPGRGGPVFWGILAVVVAALLAVISRFLPKPAPPSAK